MAAVIRFILFSLYVLFTLFLCVIKRFRPIEFYVVQLSLAVEGAVRTVTAGSRLAGRP